MIRLDTIVKKMTYSVEDYIYTRVDKNIKFYIIGCGGTGSHFISFLTQYIGNMEDNNKVKMCFIDGDIIERRNVLNQKFLNKDISKNKASVLANRYSKLYDLNIDYYDSYIDSESLIELIVNEEEESRTASVDCRYSNIFIISCVDNNAARREIIKSYESKQLSELCFNNIFYIDAGNSVGTKEITGQVAIGAKFVHRRQEIKGVNKIFPQILNEEFDDNSISCGMQGIQNIAANISSASNLFNAVVNIISFNRIPGNLVEFDILKLNQTCTTIQ